MDAIYLPRLYASLYASLSASLCASLHTASRLPAWRRAWQRRAQPVAKPAPAAAAYIPLPAMPARPPQPLRQPPRQALLQGVPPLSTQASYAEPPAYRPAPLPGRAPAEARLRVRQDPADARRVRVAGSMAEVCAALDRLVCWQESEPR